ncbi:thioredoxin-dependent thiol peroxidase [Paenibacillus sp. S-38]|uniref:thioredoxin-dependent thiol peroxidase n=1 Tax=Paenibacillus sp. S-38 TaxID=3416710 RepID=UPI003CF0331B
MTAVIGQPAPEFRLPATGGTDVSLSDFRGRPVLLYFYPKDMTPTCTSQACDLRDRAAEFSGANAVILGVSPDPVKQHEKFLAKYGLPFVLLSDEDHAAAEAYGVWQLKKLYGREYMGIERSTFIIDKDGLLVKEWRKVKVKGHVDQALQYIKEHLS